jgi:hypothetical protein
MVPFESMNIYLDIDGVLKSNTNFAASYADEFLQLILKNWPNSTYWLSTHCWKKQNSTRLVLDPVLKPKTKGLLHLIKPTVWRDLKVDAINFKQPFLWYDDDLLPEEEKVLRHHNALECFRPVDLQADKYQLLDEIEFLRTLS